MKPARVVAAFIAVCAAASSATALERAAIAAEDVDAFARVVVESAEVRSGPGMSYRTIAVVERGDTIAIDRRASDQFWLKITLDDGRSGWLLGEEVEVYAVHADEPDRPSRPGLFAPPPLVGAHGGLSLLGGVIGSRITDPATGNSSYSAADGYFEARPIYVIAPQVSVEAFGGLSRTDDGSLFLVGGWGVVHLLPDVAVDPYVGAGFGYLWSKPNSDSFAVKDDHVSVARAGGGFLFGLRGRILVRIEVTNLTLFSPDRFKNVQTFLGGLGVYF
jgi:hypothetical protein